MFNWLLASTFSLSKAIRVPSGDQAGRSSVTLFELVMFCGIATGLVRSRMKMSKLAPAPPAAYAIFVRSGDQVGWRCCTATAVVIAPPADPPPVPLRIVRR